MFFYYYFRFQVVWWNQSTILSVWRKSWAVCHNSYFYNPVIWFITHCKHHLKWLSIEAAAISVSFAYSCPVICWRVGPLWNLLWWHKLKLCVRQYGYDFCDELYRERNFVVQIFTRMLVKGGSHNQDMFHVQCHLMRIFMLYTCAHCVGCVNICPAHITGQTMKRRKTSSSPQNNIYSITDKPFAKDCTPIVISSDLDADCSS